MWKTIAQQILIELTWIAHAVKCGNRWSRLRQKQNGTFYIECYLCGAQWMEER